MHLAARAAILITLLLAGVAPAASAQRMERISPSVTLWTEIDPIEDTDYSRVEVESGSSGSGGYSYPARLSIRCSGFWRSGLVGYETPVTGVTRLIWRFDSRRPDTLALPREPRMRTYGGAGLWMVMYRPLEIVALPDSVLGRMVDAAAGATRLVIRLEGPETRRDSYFTLAGLPRALGRLSCLRPAAAARRREALRPRPIPLGEKIYYDVEHVDVEPEPADSAAVVQALRREISPANLADEPLGYVLIYLEVSAAGEVESAQAMGMARTKPALERFARSLRFRPGQVDGEPVPTRAVLYVQTTDPRR
ncbi:MAG TPA: hypothetical protein VHG08_23970 [Longimicrobium sp.]|nr:hypothetical protein [Longimicrobium sp.]